MAKAFTILGRPKKNPWPVDNKLTVYVPKEIHRALQWKSTKDEKPMVQLVTESLIKSLEDEYPEFIDELKRRMEEEEK